MMRVRGDAAGEGVAEGELGLEELEVSVMASS
jgi:hypothetical protein